MRKSLILAVAITGAALSSCTTTSHTAYTATPETMIVNMTVADLNMESVPVSATVNWNWNPFKSISSHKKSADAAALKASGADVLIEPVYEVKKRGLFRGGSVTVTGLPAMYTNFRPMTERDAEIIMTLKNKVAVATPAIFTSGPSFLSFFSTDNSDDGLIGGKSHKSFVDLVYGFPSGSGFSGASSIGVMYGRYKTWGWYGKASIDFGDGDVGFSVTGGAIRTLPLNFNVFAGIGVGKGLTDNFSLPVEVGVKWGFKSINIMLGYQYGIEFDHAGVSKPFVGIGYNF